MSADHDRLQLRAGDLVECIKSGPWALPRTRKGNLFFVRTVNGDIVHYTRCGAVGLQNEPGTLLCGLFADAATGIEAFEPDYFRIRMRDQASPEVIDCTALGD